LGLSCFRRPGSIFLRRGATIEIRFAFPVPNTCARVFCLITLKFPSFLLITLGSFPSFVLDLQHPPSRFQNPTPRPHFCARDSFSTTFCVSKPEFSRPTFSDPLRTRTPLRCTHFRSVLPLPVFSALNFSYDLYFLHSAAPFSRFPDLLFTLFQAAMLETFRSNSIERGAKFVAPSASRPHRSILGNLEISMTRSESSDSIHCPQPLRRPTSPTQPLKRRSKYVNSVLPRRLITLIFYRRRNLLTEEREREACQEIQQILGARSTPGLVRDSVSPGGTPSIGGAPTSSYTALLQTVEPAPQKLGDEDDLGHMLIRPAVPVIRHLMFGTPSIENNEFLEPFDSDMSGINDSGSNVQLHDDLTSSHESLGLADLGLTHNSARNLVGDLYEPSVTPPMRSSNPVAMNSPFCYNTDGGGAEIGLLSFSPPSSDSLLQLVGDRRARLPMNTGSEFSTRKRFGDAAPRRGRNSSLLYGGTSAPSTLDAAGQPRSRVSHTNEIF
jgi:hypothetical protein